MKVADTPNYATGLTSGAGGSRVGTAPRGAIAASPMGSFLSLLLQGQPSSPESASAGGSLNSIAGSDPQSISPKAFSLLFRGTSDGPDTAWKRKKASTETGTGTPVLVTPTPDLSRPAHWFFPLTGGQATATCLAPSSNPDIDAQPSATSSEEVAAAAHSTREDKSQPVPELLLEVMPSRESETKNAAGGAAQGTVDAAPFAELSLTPATTPAAATRVTTAQPRVSSTPSPATTFTSPPDVFEVGRPSGNAVRGPSTPEIRVENLSQGSESSLNLSSSGPKGAPPEPKKKSDNGSAQSGDSSMPSGRGGNDPKAVTVPTAPPSRDSQKTNIAPEPARETTTIAEPATTVAEKPAGSSVGTIELQIRSADDSSVGLRFVERQGHVEIQMKSGDRQTAQALSANLAGLTTSLNETGWDVQTHLFPAGQTPPKAALDQHMRASADQSGPAQLPRAAVLTTNQTNPQSDSDSSAGQDRSSTGRDDSSGRNGQHGQNASASADSERQGRRSARDSEAWLESMERNLTQS